MDPRWLESTLGVAGITGVTTTRIGQERGFAGELHRLTIAGVDRSLIAKRTEGREVQFYTTAARRVPVRTPRCYYAGPGPDSPHVLLLEEIEGQPGDVIAGCTPRQLRAVVDAISAMHTQWWGSDELARWDWLGRRDADPEGLAARYRLNYPRFLRRFGRNLPPEALDIAARLVDNYPTLLRKIAALPRTLIHGDLHLDNIIFTAEGPSFVDWQGVSAGSAWFDVAQLCVESLAVGSMGDIEAAVSHYVHRVPEASTTDFAAALMRLWAGAVSGYGARDPASMSPRFLRVARVEIQRIATAVASISHP